MRSEELGVRSGGRGASNLYSTPIPLFIFGFTGNMEVRVTILLYMLFLTWNAIESVTRLEIAYRVE